MEKHNILCVRYLSKTHFVRDFLPKCMLKTCKTQQFCETSSKNVTGRHDPTRHESAMYIAGTSLKLQSAKIYKSYLEQELTLVYIKLIIKHHRATHRYQELSMFLPARQPCVSAPCCLGHAGEEISPAGDPNSKIQTGTKRKIWKQLLFSTHRPSLPWTPSSHNRDTITK